VRLVSGRVPPVLMMLHISRQSAGRSSAAYRGPQRRALINLVVFLLLAVPAVFGLTARHPQKKKAEAAVQGKPSVQQVDPPNWWSGLPNPMLLLHGNHLAGAQITSSNPGISIRRVRISSSGHWAFVWLDISGAPPSVFSLIVHTDAGRVRVPYQLLKRHAPTDGFQGFSPADVMYLVMPDRFAQSGAPADGSPDFRKTISRSDPNAYHGGNLAGITQHLDYIHALGATTLWITPVDAQDPSSPSDYSGYAPIDLYRLNPHFGSLADFEQLAAQVHAQGMKLVLDIVMNQVGPASLWVNDPPAPDWFHGTMGSHIPASSDFALATDPHGSEASRAPVVDGWLFNALPDLNQSNPLVRQYLIQNVVWWTETGALDGLRLDTVANVNRGFWQSLHTVLHLLYPHLTTVGEVASPDPAVVAYFAGGVKHDGIDTGLYTLFDYPGYFALQSALAGGSQGGYSPMSAISDVQRSDWFYPDPERLVTFFDNQDTRRLIAEPGADAGTVKLAFGLIATMRGLPQIFAGDEIGLKGTTLADNRPDFPGGFPGDAADAFTQQGRSSQQQDLYTWASGLLALRAQHPALQMGQQQTLLAGETGFAYARYLMPQRAHGAAAALPQETLLIAMNKGAAPRTIHLDFSRTVLSGTTSLTPLWNTQQALPVNGDHCDIPLQPQQFVIYAATH
jgi:glycosidase